MISVDPCGDLMAGSVEWLRRNPGYFGRTPKQYHEGSQMFLWPDAKLLWKSFIFGECRKRAETIVLVNHVKAKYDGRQKTNELVAEGLDILEKLATLYLWVDRPVEAKSKQAVRMPCAIVKKDRLVEFGRYESEDRPILPPRMPKATANWIRRYLLLPADYDNLKPGERMPDESMTPDERLMVHSGIAANQATAASAQWGMAEMMSRAGASQGAAMLGLLPAVGGAGLELPPAPEAPQNIPPPTAIEAATVTTALADQTISQPMDAGQQDQSAFQVETIAPALQPVQPAQVQTIMALAEQLCGSKEAAIAALKQNGIHGPQDLDFAKADTLVSYLRQQIAGMGDQQGSLGNG